MFSLIMFSSSAMDSHSKREVLETFNMNKENVAARFLFLTDTNWSIFYDFSKKSHVTYHAMF